jgi:hypothetical protein
MSDAKVFVADLINDRIDIHGNGHTPEGTSFDTEAPAAVEAELAKRRQQLAELEADFRASPAAVVARFRRLYHDDSLTEDDVRGWIETWRLAFDDPDGFKQSLEGDAPFGVGDWFDRLRAYVHLPKEVTGEERAVLGRLAEAYRLDVEIVKQILPSKRQFELLDPGWVPLALDKVDEKLKNWPAVLDPFRRHENYPSGFVYPGHATLDDSRTSRVALFADWGTGYYHSAAIARQLMKARYPYAFHLGDVYYGGKQAEFDDRWTDLLAPVVEHTRLFGLAENHELYSKGTAYLRYFDRLRAAGQTDQEGSYFCVRFAKHQIIGIDVNWNGRQAFLDQRSRDWLAAQLRDGEGLTTILLSGSAPYHYGSEGRRSLLGNLWDFVEDGQVHAWFWGDDHYCALFSRDQTTAPFIGSCIGHGGYPGDKQAPNRPSWTRPIWVETGARFPKWTKLRQDRGNAGWVEMNLRNDGGIELTYIDWLGAKRFFATLALSQGALVPIAPREFPDREQGTPELFVPRP